MAIYAFSLTSLSRLKARLGISDTSYDTILTQLINEATDAIQGYCGRRFIESTYENELYDGGDGSRASLILMAYPVSSISAIGERSGTVTSPSWRTMSVDEYEAVDRQAAITSVRPAFISMTGIVRFGSRLFYGINNYRVSYVAGYKISWANEGDLTLHNLPLDLTSACEQLCAAMFNMRKNAGVGSESLGAHSVTWSDMLGSSADSLGTSAVAKTITRYRSLAAF